MKDLYERLRGELTIVWNQLRSIPIGQLMAQEKTVEEKMEQIEAIAAEIGGQLQVDVQKLRVVVLHFLNGKMNLSEVNGMIERFLKVEQDTREL